MQKESNQSSDATSPQLRAGEHVAAEYESCACVDDAVDADVYIDDIDVKSRDVDFESVAKQKR